MKYYIVTNRAQDRIDFETLDAFIAYVRDQGWHVTGTRHGQPIVKELFGPHRDKDSSFRYEDWESCDVLSS